MCLVMKSMGTRGSWVVKIRRRVREILSKVIQRCHIYLEKIEKSTLFPAGVPVFAGKNVNNVFEWSTNERMDNTGLIISTHSTGALNIFCAGKNVSTYSSEVYRRVSSFIHFCSKITLFIYYYYLFIYLIRFDGGWWRWCLFISTGYWTQSSSDQILQEVQHPQAYHRQTGRNPNPRWREPHSFSFYVSS